MGDMLSAKKKIDITEQQERIAKSTSMKYPFRFTVNSRKIK
jgi:hypothetical protein